MSKFLYGSSSLSSFNQINARLLSSSRSPGLAAVSGCAATFISGVTIFRYMLASEEDESTGAVDGLLLIPMMPTLYTGPYILRGLRLLVMYNPRLRKRWGAFAREAGLLRSMVASCVVFEVVVWTLALVFGLKRSVATCMRHISEEERFSLFI